MANPKPPRLTSFAPQFLVDDLERSMSYYRRLGFTFGDPWGGFYAIGELDGLELHLKEASKNGAERQHRRERRVATRTAARHRSSVLRTAAHPPADRAGGVASPDVEPSP